jgi:hypothetical protein
MLFTYSEDFSGLYIEGAIGSYMAYNHDELEY